MPSSRVRSQPVQSRVVPWLYWPLALLGRVALKAYFRRVEISGREHLPQRGAVVLAPKHFSRWDPLIVSTLYWQPAHYMTMTSQFEGAQGWLIRQLGAFPVNIEHPQVSSLRHAKELLRSGHRLVIFPEGGIVRDELLRPLKPGLARLVLQAEADLPGLQVPIVPVAIHYQPNSVFGAQVRLQVCQALYTQDYLGKNHRATASALTAALENTLRDALSQTP